MIYFDIHTHHQPENPEAAIWNCRFDNRNDLVDATYCSQGLHPWYLPKLGVDAQIKDLYRNIEDFPSIVAIGETGLDKLCDTPWEAQIEAFQAQIAVAHHFEKPLIIHCVKAYNEVINEKRETITAIPWVIHGFRGKPQLAKQLIDEGFYLSYGFRYNEESLHSTPLGRLFLETDESEAPIEQLYQRVAADLQMSTKELNKQVIQNVDKVFFKR